MRKQANLLAVLSASALLALGTSMVSFAAAGWQEENGTWVYYDKNGDQVMDEWQKSGDKWYYLDDSGEMATELLVETNDNYYYVDENGAMVTNHWVSISNEDYDGDEDEPENYWYYFQSNGKAMKGSDGKVSLKTINNKKYSFDSEGRMMTGWVNESGDRETGEDAWRDGLYYFGGHNDGALTIGWKELAIVDNDASEDAIGFDMDTAFTDTDQVRWFYFNSNGKKVANETGKTINGRKYAFDQYGRMVAQWRMNAEPAKNVASDSSALASMPQADKSQSWRFYGSPEDGARVTKGWFKVVPAEYLNSSDYDDDESNWYYSDSNGKLLAGEMKTIQNKKYAFDQFGSMVHGLKFISVDASQKSRILAVHDDEWYDTEEKFESFANGDSYNADDGLAPDFTGASGHITYCYYFGDENDGAMKTGNQNIELDGDKFTFLFQKSGSDKGTGKHGEDNDKLYLHGKLLKAEHDERYSVAEVEKNASGQITGMRVLTTDQFITGVMTKEEVIAGGYTKYDDKNTYYSFRTAPDSPVSGATYEYRLINTSGKIIDNKTNAKDGSDISYDVKGETIVAVYEKN